MIVPLPTSKSDEPPAYEQVPGERSPSEKGLGTDLEPAEHLDASYPARLGARSPGDIRIPSPDREASLTAQAQY